MFEISKLIWLKFVVGICVYIYLFDILRNEGLFNMVLFVNVGKYKYLICVFNILIYYSVFFIINKIFEYVNWKN